MAKEVSCRLQAAARPSQEQTQKTGLLQEVRRAAQRVAASWLFEAFFAAVIASNSIFIGISIEWEARERTLTLPGPLLVVQFGYTVLFISELSIKLVAHGPHRFFWSLHWAWNWFDVVLVATAVFECIIEVVAQDEQVAGSSSNLRILRILRMTRITRIFRVIRVVRFFRSLRTLVFSIVNTLKSLFWAMLLLALIIYVFGILLTDVANNYIVDSPGSEANTMLDQYFGNLHASSQTLFMSISGGLTWVEAARALNHISLVWVYLFTSYIAFCCFAVLNVMTGVFCQSAIKGAERDQEMVVQSLLMDKQHLKESVSKLFQKMDDDQCGKLSLLQFEKHFEDEEVRVLFEALEIGATDAWTLFCSLDHNEDYQIEPEEFLEGCIQLRGAAKAIDLWMLRRQVAKIMQYLLVPESTLGAALDDTAKSNLVVA